MSDERRGPGYVERSPTLVRDAPILAVEDLPCYLLGTMRRVACDLGPQGVVWTCQGAWDAHAAEDEGIRGRGLTRAEQAAHERRFRSSDAACDPAGASVVVDFDADSTRFLCLCGEHMSWLHRHSERKTWGMSSAVILRRLRHGPWIDTTAVYRLEPIVRAWRAANPGWEAISVDGRHP